jgi:hypothetical protein
MMSRRLGQVMSQPNPIVCTLRNTIFRLMPSSVQLRNLEGIVGFEV